MSDHNKIVIISGPTATGKTDLSMSLSKLTRQHSSLEPVIVNFDSLCFFKEVSIGTAKPTLEERGDILHELFEIHSISEDFNASKYVSLAEKKINELLSENKLVFLVGGSAFYLRALIKGMFESQEVDEELKTSTKKKYEKEGIGFIIEYLNNHDPEILSKLHENDHYRLTRAYFHHKSTGLCISEEKNRMDKINPYDLSQDIKQDWRIHHIYLNIPKEEHYQIIEKRTEKMIQNGLVEEVSELLSCGFTGKEKPLQSIGYKEVLEFLSSNENSSINNEKELIERIFISTRQLAKSQRTFFNKITPKIE